MRTLPEPRLGRDAWVPGWGCRVPSSGRRLIFRMKPSATRGRRLPHEGRRLLMMRETSPPRGGSLPSEGRRLLMTRGPSPPRGGSLPREGRRLISRMKPSPAWGGRLPREGRRLLMMRKPSSTVRSRLHVTSGGRHVTRARALTKNRRRFEKKVEVLMSKNRSSGPLTAEGPRRHRIEPRRVGPSKQRRKS